MITIKCILFHKQQWIDLQFYQQHINLTEIKEQEIFEMILDYVYQNSGQTGFVTKTKDWRVSSTHDFFGIKN
jgi:hypothetical protein